MPVSIDRLFADRGRAVPLAFVAPKDYTRWRREATASARRFADDLGFKAEAASMLMLAGADGRLARVVAGIAPARTVFDFAHLSAKLPAGFYRIEGRLSARDAQNAALGWALGAYVFDRYRKKPAPKARLLWPAACDKRRVAALVESIALVRDLVNTPANDLGPADLAAAARTLARRHRARYREIVGRALLARDFPAIHAVGRAAAVGREPRLIDFSWGDARAPKVTLVGKGVCFDSGGLDLKTASGMLLMKKDMGGAAHALGLAHLIMAAKLKVRLRVLIPAVENSVSGDAMRPLDVIATRMGLTVEIGNTDAEGRVILSDALAEASRDKPALLIDFATLTGAARVALGTELPALFCNDDALADELLAASRAEADPMWRLPLWQGYAKQVEGKVADLTNSPEGSYAGAVTAALFLERFVGTGIPWVHLDLMAWNTTSRPGRPEGGEAQALRALYALIVKRFDRSR